MYVVQTKAKSLTVESFLDGILAINSWWRRLMEEKLWQKQATVERATWPLDACPRIQTGHAI
jgi:hypothetical protein